MVYGTQITIVTGANLNQLTSLGGLTLKDAMGYSMLRQIHTLLTKKHENKIWVRARSEHNYYNYTYLIPEFGKTNPLLLIAR